MRKAPEPLTNPVIDLIEEHWRRERAMRDRRGYLARLRVRMEAEADAERKGRMRRTYISMCYGMSPRLARLRYLEALTVAEASGPPEIRP